IRCFRPHTILLSAIIVGMLLIGFGLPALAQDSALRRAVDPLTPEQRAAQQIPESGEEASEGVLELGDDEPTTESQINDAALEIAIAQMMFVTMVGTTGATAPDRSLLGAYGI